MGAAADDAPHVGARRGRGVRLPRARRAGGRRWAPTTASAVGGGDLLDRPGFLYALGPRRCSRARRGGGRGGDRRGSLRPLSAPPPAASPSASWSGRAPAGAAVGGVGRFRAPPPARPPVRGARPDRTPRRPGVRVLHVAPPAAPCGAGRVVLLLAAVLLPRRSGGAGSGGVEASPFAAFQRWWRRADAPEEPVPAAAADDRRRYLRSAAVAVAASTLAFVALLVGSGGILEPRPTADFYDAEGPQPPRWPPRCSCRGAGHRGVPGRRPDLHVPGALPGGAPPARRRRHRPVRRSPRRALTAAAFAVAGGAIAGARWRRAPAACPGAERLGDVERRCMAATVVAATGGSSRSSPSPARCPCTTRAPCGASRTVADSGLAAVLQHRIGPRRRHLALSSPPSPPSGRGHRSAPDRWWRSSFLASGELVRRVLVVAGRGALVAGRGVVAGRAGAAMAVAALPVVVYCGLNVAKFGSLASVPCDAQVYSSVSSGRQEFLARNEGSFFGLRFGACSRAGDLRPLHRLLATIPLILASAPRGSAPARASGRRASTRSTPRPASPPPPRCCSSSRWLGRPARIRSRSGGTGRSAAVGAARRGRHRRRSSSSGSPRSATCPTPCRSACPRRSGCRWPSGAVHRGLRRARRALLGTGAVAVAASVAVAVALGLTYQAVYASPGTLVATQRFVDLAAGPHLPVGRDLVVGPRGPPGGRGSEELFVVGDCDGLYLSDGPAPDELSRSSHEPVERTPWAPTTSTSPSRPGRGRARASCSSWRPAYAPAVLAVEHLGGGECASTTSSASWRTPATRWRWGHSTHHLQVAADPGTGILDVTLDGDVPALHAVPATPSSRSWGSIGSTAAPPNGSPASSNPDPTTSGCAAGCWVNAGRGGGPQLVEELVGEARGPGARTPHAVDRAELARATRCRRCSLSQLAFELRRRGRPIRCCGSTTETAGASNAPGRALAASVKNRKCPVEDAPPVVVEAPSATRGRGYQWPKFGTLTSSVPPRRSRAEPSRRRAWDRAMKPNTSTATNVEPSPTTSGRPRLQVGLDELVDAAPPDAARFSGRRRPPCARRAERSPSSAVATAEVEHSARRPTLETSGRALALHVGSYVIAVVGLEVGVERHVATEADLMPRYAHVDGALARVLHPVDVADLLAVEGRDRQLTIRFFASWSCRMIWVSKL